MVLFQETDGGTYPNSVQIFETERGTFKSDHAAARRIKMSEQ
jgi:hypothetical protein